MKWFPRLRPKGTAPKPDSMDPIVDPLPIPERDDPTALISRLTAQRRKGETQADTYKQMVENIVRGIQGGA